MAASMSAAVNSNVLVIPGLCEAPRAVRAVATLGCGWGTDVSRSHWAARLCLRHSEGMRIKASEIAGNQQHQTLRLNLLDLFRFWDLFKKKSSFFSLSQALHLLHTSFFGLNFLGSVCMFVLYKQGSCIQGIFACSGLFFFPVQNFSPSFSKSFKGSIDVRVCLLAYCMYMTEHLYNFWTFTCSLIL